MNISLVIFINFKEERYSRNTKDDYLINSLFGVSSNYNSKKESATICVIVRECGQTLGLGLVDKNRTVGNY